MDATNEQDHKQTAYGHANYLLEKSTQVKNKLMDFDVRDA